MNPMAGRGLSTALGQARIGGRAIVETSDPAELNFPFRIHIGKLQRRTPALGMLGRAPKFCCLPPPLRSAARSKILAAVDKNGRGSRPTLRTRNRRRSRREIL